MQRLINDAGRVAFGVFDSPVDEINYKDYPLTSPMGFKWPGLFNGLKFNQFVFFGLTGPDVMVGLAVVDLKFLSNAFLYVYDRKQGLVVEVNKTIVPISRKIFITPTPENLSCGFSFGGLDASMQGNKISAASKNIELDITMDLQKTTPLRVCTRAGYKGWTFTRKTSPIRLTGTVAYNGQRIDVSSPAHMGLMDWTAGFMRRETFWNWAAIAATLPDGRPLGLNLSCGVNETSFTENAFWVDGRMTKVSTVLFEFDPENFYAPWTITSPDGKINLIFKAGQHRAENINAGVVATKFNQMMGVFNGTLTAEDGEVVAITDCPGWTEDHYAKW
ncbi:MAG: DUF2804 domain-containing protein [Desulfobacteraceae bacterium]|nr:MAG: DUF2804 domain-containing protein [Desulfobacteraceae bacterium]